MLFNSYIFILAFFPIVLIIYFVFHKIGCHNVAKLFLIVSSFVFYGWLNPLYVFVIAGSIIGNYLFYLGICKYSAHKTKIIFICGIIFNIFLIGYFKYYDFLTENINEAFKQNYNLLNVALPLGISFYTFQQIGFLADTYRGEVSKCSFFDYVLFVSFFPQLVAGPIVRFSKMIPQFNDTEKWKCDWGNLSWGFTLFSFGLAKKVLMADSLALGVEWYWNNIEIATAGEAILSMLMYTFQIYFDFSGYCDMASGIALCFNIQLPVNFNQPYRALSIVDFWGRWHMTLSEFMKDYLYIPLGGNRKGKLRTYLNIIVVFLISGLWHGASWTFVIWGGMHGIVNAFDRIAKRVNEKVPVFFRWAASFIFINLAWVMFRAPSIDGALDTYLKLFSRDYSIGGAFLLNYYLVEFIIPDHLIFKSNPYLCNLITIILIAFVVSVFCPPVIRKKGNLSLKMWFSWVFMVWSVMSLSTGGTFIYFNF